MGLVSAPGVFRNYGTYYWTDYQKPNALEYLVDIMNLYFFTYVLMESSDKSWNMLNW